ncbi:MAG TPA: VTT domain-containing protein [Casimicrobiaceae bacterium]
MLYQPSPALSAQRSPERPDFGKALLTPGRNCWRIEHADRVAFLVDGEDYFAAVRDALARARRSFFIVGWDIDSRMHLVPGGARDGLPEPLGDFLNALVAERRGLRGYVLSWDFAMLYAAEREWLPVYKLDWRTHRRLSFRLDDRHPTGSSHHQKFVVVDDAVAFVSGYDLTRARWDTSGHVADDPRRVDHRGQPYAPFHDVGMAVGGDCARALGELARDRWRRATGRQPRRVAQATVDDVWPAIESDITNIDVAIARTEPAYDGRQSVNEIRNLYIDAIAAVRCHFFAENQYFTSRTLANAFAQRLSEPDPPDIAIVSPYIQCGWLENSTMGVLRARNHRALREADHEGNYRLYSPILPWLDHDETCLNVHSKVTIVDDDFAMIGSANLADRSLGIDTECNLAIEARGDARIRRAIARLRERLLGEHLDCSAEEVAAAMAREGHLHRAIDALADRSNRTLRAIEPRLDQKLDALVPDHQLLDPEQPIDPDAIVADLVPEENARSSHRYWLIAAAFVGAALLAMAWRFTPLSEWLALDRLIDIGVALREHPWAPLAVMAIFVLAGLVLFPLSVLIIVMAIVYGPVLGPIYTLCGAALSAAVTFWVGRKLGRETVRKLAGSRLNDLSRRLARRGFLPVMIARLLPVGPYSILNLVAGASHIGWRNFLIGTVLGLAPGVITTSVFVDRAIAAIREPTPETFAVLAVIVTAIVALAWAIRRILRARGGGPRAPAVVMHGS